MNLYFIVLYWTKETNWKGLAHKETFIIYNIGYFVFDLMNYLIYLWAYFEDVRLICFIQLLIHFIFECFNKDLF
jgi:hypothetical protein